MATNDYILTLVGINHKTSSISQREQLIIEKKKIPEVLKRIYSYDGVESVVILSTCNRFEFYLVIDKNLNLFNIIGKLYFDFLNIDIYCTKELFYIKKGNEVVNHLYRVISGLESLVLGEYQIQGQVKDAYSMACEYKTVEKVIHKLFHAAFRTGKKVRTETFFGKTQQSVSSSAVKILTDEFSIDASISIIGVNENTKIIAESLKKSGYNNLKFVNRTYYKAEMLANQFNGEAYRLSDIELVLKSSDAICTCTGAQSYIISSTMLNKLASIGKGPCLLLDLAIPRDVEINELPKTIKYYDLQSIQNILQKHKSVLESEIPKAERIISDEEQLFLAWTNNQISDLLSPYSEKFELIRQQVIQENSPYFTDSDYEKVDKISRQLLHRLQSTFVKILLKEENKTQEH